MTFSINDAKNEAGEWLMSPEQIRAEMAYEDEPNDDFDYDDYDDENECEGHPSTNGPIGNVVYCDGTCR